MQQGAWKKLVKICWGRLLSSKISRCCEKSRDEVRPKLGLMKLEAFSKGNERFRCIVRRSWEEAAR